MKAATIQEIKEELENKPVATVLALCLKLAKYKKENKELLSYLLFQSHDEHGFVENAKKEIDDLFQEITATNSYLLKKSLRKILSMITKYSRHTGTKQSEMEMLLQFCKNLNESGISFRRNAALNNLYERQVKKINALLLLLHDDLQYDYKKTIDKLQ